MSAGYERDKRKRAAAKQELRFYPNSHRYKLDGEFVPGVTTVLKVLDKSRPLIIWATRLVADYVAQNKAVVDGLYAAGPGPLVAALTALPDQRRDTAADRGHTLHDFAEQLLNDVDVDVPDELVPVVEQAIAFLHDWQIEPVLVEVPVGSRVGKYAGTLDLGAKYVNPITGDSGLGLFDWKSGKRIYHETAFQLVGYGFADFYLDTSKKKIVDAKSGAWTAPEEPMPTFDAAFGVHITADGYAVHPLVYGRSIFDEFLTIREAFAANKRAEGDWKTPGTGYVGVPFPLPTDTTREKAS